MDVKKLLKKFVKYQIEWLTMHDDVEFEPEEEQLIIKFLKDTEKCFMLENKDLPSVKPAEKVGRWIPVSERLPEFTIDIPVVGKRYTEDVLVYDGADLRVGYFVRNDTLDFNYWVAYNEDDYVPIAWMPIEPYKASSTGVEKE